MAQQLSFMHDDGAGSDERRHIVIVLGSGKEPAMGGLDTATKLRTDTGVRSLLTLRQQRGCVGPTFLVFCGARDEVHAMAARARGKLEEGGLSGATAARLIKLADPGSGSSHKARDVVDAALGARDVELGVERLQHIRGLTAWVVCGLAQSARAGMVFEAALPFARQVVCVPAYGLPGGCGSAEAAKALARHGKVDEDAAKLKRRNALLEVLEPRLARARAQCESLRGFGVGDGVVGVANGGGGGCYGGGTEGWAPRYVRIVCGDAGAALALGAPRVVVDEAHTGAPLDARVTFPVRLVPAPAAGGGGDAESQWALVPVGLANGDFAAKDDGFVLLVNRAYPHLKVTCQGAGCGAGMAAADAWAPVDRATAAHWRAVPVGGTGGPLATPLVKLEARWLGGDKVEKCLQAAPGGTDPAHAHFGLVEVAVAPLAWASAAFRLDHVNASGGGASSLAEGLAEVSFGDDWNGGVKSP